MSTTPAERVTKKVIVVIAVLLVLGALGGGFYLVGPPARERERRLDGRRVNDLQRLRLAADLYWTRNGRLPATLDALAKEAGTNIYSSDPASGERYAYAVTSSDTYELCAVFTGESETRRDFWSHGPGRQCFRISARGIKSQ
jgi:hypothetical protein